MISWITQIDLHILYYVQDNLRNEVLNGVVKAFTSLGNYGLIWIYLGSADIFRYKESRNHVCGGIDT